MRLTRVFVDAPLAAGSAVALPPDAAAHLTRVLRLGAGDDCILFNGRGGEYAARIASVGKRVTLADVVAHDPVERESPLRILLLQALARGEKMDLVVQKATELGVAAIRPVQTLHSGVKLAADQSARKVEHWRAVAISACEQCQRNRVPQVLEPLSLGDALIGAPAGTRLTLSLSVAAARGAQLSRESLAASEWITVLVGPEGGFAPSEEEEAVAAGFSGLRLGPRVLRTETAGLAAVSLLQSIAGDWLVR